MAVDATAVPADRGGVGRYVDELLPALAAEGADLVVVCQIHDVPHYAELVPGADLRAAPAVAARRPVRLLWEQVGLSRLARKAGAEVLHCPHYTMPLVAGMPVVTTLHDATFFTHPDVHLPVKRRFFRTWTRISLARARRCLTPSAATRDELVRVAGADPARVDVAHLGVDPQRFHVPSAEERAAARAHLGIEGPYLAFLGTLEPRKNLPALIRAWSTLDGAPDLVLAGGRGWDTEIDRAAAQVPDGHRLHLPGYLPLELLAGFLGEAELVVYPSLGEGFGLPVLEAMACGAPVLTTRLLAIPEIGGDAVAYTAHRRGVDRRGPPGPARRPRAPRRARDGGTGARRGVRLAVLRPRPPGRLRSGGRRMTGTLRVAVVTYSPGETLEEFVTSLRRATVRPLDVVLADNGSTDGVPERVAAASGDVRLLPTGGNVGYGAAANAALADVHSGWALIANPDIRFEDGAIDELLAAAERWPRAATLGPAIRTPQGALYPSARDLPSLSTGIGHAALGWLWPANPWTARYRRERDTPRERTAGWLSGSCFLVDMEAFHSVGGFDPAYFMYFEDVDLAERLTRRGWLHVYAPSAVVTHEGGHATSREPRPDAAGAPHQRDALPVGPVPPSAARAAALGAPGRPGWPDAAVLRQRPGRRRGATAAHRGRAAPQPKPPAAAMSGPSAGRSTGCSTR